MFNRKVCCSTKDIDISHLFSIIIHQFIIKYIFSFKIFTIIMNKLFKYNFLLSYPQDTSASIGTVLSFSCLKLPCASSFKRQTKVVVFCAFLESSFLFLRKFLTVLNVPMLLTNPAYTWYGLLFFSTLSEERVCLYNFPFTITTIYLSKTNKYYIQQYHTHFFENYKMFLSTVIDWNSDADVE